MTGSVAHIALRDAIGPCWEEVSQVGVTIGSAHKDQGDEGEIRFRFWAPFGRFMGEVHYLTYWSKPEESRPAHPQGQDRMLPRQFRHSRVTILEGVDMPPYRIPVLRTNP